MGTDASACVETPPVIFWSLHEGPDQILAGRQFLEKKVVLGDQTHIVTRANELSSASELPFGCLF